MLWTGADLLYRPALHAQELNRQRNANATRANPVLLLLRLCIESAFVDALRTRDGKPTEEAIAAVCWIEARTDWTRRPGPIPPEAIRGEIIFSFEWCCSLLNLFIEEIRQHGIRRLSGFAHNSRVMLPGIPGIKRHWQKAREEYEERMAQQPREQPQGAMEISV